MPPDIIDAAQEMESQERLASISAARTALLGPGPFWIDGQAYCIICEGKIPEARVNAMPNTSWCIICAEEQERMF